MRTDSLKRGRVVRPATGNVLRLQSTFFRYYAARLVGLRVSNLVGFGPSSEEAPSRSSMALEENVDELVHPRQHAAETGKCDRQEDCAKRENCDEMRPDQVDAGAPAQDRLREFDEMHGR